MKILNKDSYLTHSSIVESFYYFCKNFPASNEIEITDNPYLRPMYFEEEWIEEIIQNPKDHSNQAEFFAQKLLFNIYEQDLLFLPEEMNDEKHNQYNIFYDENIRTAGKIIKLILESYLFSSLSADIEATGPWNADYLMNYFFNDLKDFDTTESQSLKVILSSVDPKRALDNYLIQCCGDFLTEASGMSRNILGNYGRIQSELFKVLIDEYGYGVHASKHSTLFEKLLNDQGLSKSSHTYWNYYLTSSLNIHNYIHYVSDNHRNFFKYIGALYYAEATYPHICAQISSTIKNVSGNNAETAYFDEHVHIDYYHKQMVLNKIITPIINKYDNRFIIDFIKGYEEFKLVLGSLEKDFIEQVFLMDSAEIRKKEGYSEILFSKEKDKSTISRVTDEDVILINDTSHSINVYYGYASQRIIKSREKEYIPRGKLYGYVGS